MAIPPSAPMYSAYAFKRRRTATAVLAGDFDPRPQRDVLTSVLNGVPVYDPVEKAELEEERRARKKEKKEREKEREQDKKRAKSLSIVPEKSQAVAAPSAVASTSTAPAKRPQPNPVPRVTPPTTSSFWQARPAINIATGHRSNSVTPPPMPPSSPPTTPGPSLSSATSTASSKRPHTPDDGDNLTDRGRSVDTMSPQPEQVAKPPRKKRQAARKGWKGWVEGSPPPSEKLINLDVVPMLGERKTRSGKSFDAIGVGKDSWV
ncbi:hypothetical protein BDY19DRAFT_1041148 [Irpex rosettiformis]|uniref:Uncharacterized protein n=1 Tax=Irpex rosettiformis TaxID=378272 RepID=A0ACB8U7P2_9APHY|nr:hypothetical protein BDY19DRAFT_1041148 [Irpex rosettiformis]